MPHTFRRAIALPAALGVCALLLSAGVLSAVLIRGQPPAPPALPAPPAAPIGKPAVPAAPLAASKAERRFGIEKPLARPAGTIRLASYNLENLFDDQDDPALSGQYEDAKATKPDADCKAVAAAIKATDADIIAVQEIESLQSLTWFRDKYLTGLGYDHIACIDAGDERGIEQGVLSRFPVKDTQNWLQAPLGGTHPDKFGKEANKYAGQPIVFHRSPLRVTVAIPAAAAGPGSAAFDLTLFVIHYKSGGPGNYWREKEAAKTAELVAAFEATHKDASVIVLGDFNCQLTEPPLKTLSAAGLIDAFKDRSAKDPTIITHASGRVIDHMMMNKTAHARMVMESRFVLGTITRPDGVDFRTTPNPEGWASDHYPVVVDLRPTPISTPIPTTIPITPPTTPTNPPTPVPGS